MPSKFKLPQNIEMTFETTRLIVRPTRESDKEFFIALHTDDKTMKYSGGMLDNVLAEQKFFNALQLNNNSNLSFKTWTVLDKKTKELIGVQVLFTPLSKEPTNTLEIGIILSRKAQGKLLPEEAMGGLMEYAYRSLGTQRIVANFDRKNLATKRFVKKLGFVFCHEQSNEQTQHIFFAANDWVKKIIVS